MLNIQEIDRRLSEVERKTRNYSSNIEPKSGEYKGQTWYDTTTEVLNAWNGREYAPAYGKSIVQDLDDNKTAIEQNTTDISLRVEKTEILSEINLSTEGVRILGSKIRLDGNVFVDGTFTLDSINDGDIYKRVTTIEKSGASRAYNSINEFNRYNSWLLGGELDPGINPSTGLVIDSAGLRLYKAGLNTINLDQNGDAFFRGNIYAVNGTFTGSITSSATITGGIIIGSTIKTDTGNSAGHYERVQIGAGINKIQVFDTNNNEILNIGYNVSGFNNIFWTTVGNDGFIGPIIYAKSGRNANVVYLENTNSSASLPVVYAKTSGNNAALELDSTKSTNSTSTLISLHRGNGNAGYFRKNKSSGQAVVYAYANDSSESGFSTNGRMFASGNITTDDKLVSYGGITTTGLCQFYNQEKFYFRFNDVYLKVDAFGTLFWNDGSGEKEVAFV